MSRKLGKIEHQLFEAFIQDRCGQCRPEVSAGPQFGVDVSIVDLPQGMGLAMTSDPLSLIPSLGLEESAWLSVHLMANDMATTGWAPMYGQFVLNLPAHLSRGDFNIYWGYIHKFCAEIGIAITGGHTGFIDGQNSTIAGGGTFMTVAPRNQMLTCTSAQPGDAILVTKQCALSSAAILALSFPETVKNKAGKEIHRLASESFYQTSSLPDALLAVGDDKGKKEVSAMHDVTEGGVLGAIYELSVASGNGAIIYNEKLPLGEVQERVCQIFALDQRYCIGAGSMVITCRKKSVASIRKRLSDANIPCTEVGKITSKDEGIRLMRDGHTVDLPYLEEDPYWSAFFNALNARWK